jgi:hypothetical protein
MVVTPPAECPAAATRSPSNRPRSASPAVPSSASTLSSAYDTSAGWLSTSRTLLSAPFEVCGNVGAATTKPAAAHRVSSLA